MLVDDKANARRHELLPPLDLLPVRLIVLDLGLDRFHLYVKWHLPGLGGDEVEPFSPSDDFGFVEEGGTGQAIISQDLSCYRQLVYALPDASHLRAPVSAKGSHSVLELPPKGGSPDKSATWSDKERSISRLDCGDEFFDFLRH